MKLVATKSPAGEQSDCLEFLRHDGSVSEIDMARQGVLPHELVHYVVETGFGFSRGFLSLVARGAEARELVQLTHDPANAEAYREAVVAEALVEALHARLRDGTFDFDSFECCARGACAARNVPPPAHLDPRGCRSVYEAAVNLHAQLAKVAPHGTLELVFNVLRA